MNCYADHFQQAFQVQQKKKKKITTLRKEIDNFIILTRESLNKRNNFLMEIAMDETTTKKSYVPKWNRQFSIWGMKSVCR